MRKVSKWARALMVYILCVAITFTMTPINLIAWGAEVADQETGKTQAEQTAGAAKVGTAAADNQSSNGETSTDTAKDSAAQATDEKSVAESSSDNNAAEQSAEGGKDRASGTDQSDQGQSGSSQSASDSTANNNEQSATGEKTGAADSDSATDAKAVESDKDSDSSNDSTVSKKANVRKVAAKAASAPTITIKVDTYVMGSSGEYGKKYEYSTTVKSGKTASISKYTAVTKNLTNEDRTVKAGDATYKYDNTFKDGPGEGAATLDFPNTKKISYEEAAALAGEDNVATINVYLGYKRYYELKYKFYILNEDGEYEVAKEQTLKFEYNKNPGSITEKSVSSLPQKVVDPETNQASEFTGKWLYDNDESKIVSFPLSSTYDEAAQLIGDGTSKDIDVYAQYEKHTDKVKVTINLKGIRDSSGNTENIEQWRVSDVDWGNGTSFSRRQFESGTGVTAGNNSKSDFTYMGYRYTYQNKWNMIDDEGNVLKVLDDDKIYSVIAGNKESSETKIYVSEDTEYTFTPVYSKTMIRGLDYEYIDRISTGSGSWSNADAFEYRSEFGSLTHTFKNPEDGSPNYAPHYSFQYWQTDEYTISDNEQGDNTRHVTSKEGERYYYEGCMDKDGNQLKYKFDYSVDGGLKEGSVTKVKVYAYWQPSVTINYHVLGKTTENEVFDKKLKVYDDAYKPETSEDIHFAGWYDKDGNKISEDKVYELPEITKKCVERTVYDVYAKFTTTHTVTKKWNDANNMDGLRKDSVEVKLLANGEEVKDSDGNIMTVKLSEENEWKFTFEDLDAYDENNKLIAYTTEETTDLGNDYKASYDYDNIIDEVTGDVIRAIATFITNTLVPKVTIKAADGEWTYDGKAHTDSKVTKIKGNLFPGDELVATATGSVTNVADSKKGNNIIEDGDFKIMRGDEDVTEMYNITREPGTLTIKKAPLTVTTSSASKTYDGKALTADAKVNGLVNGETVTVNATGSQIEVGSSKNTYRLSWNGTASESNYEITEHLGTLTITASPSDNVDPDPGDNGGKDPSGGKTTPTNDPGRRGNGGNTPTTVNGGTTRTNGALTASTNTSSGTVNGNRNTDTAPQDLTEIEDQKTPLAKTQDKWALLNLILMILTVLLCLWMVAGTLRRNQDADRNEDEKTVKRKKILKLLSLIPAIAAVIAFILTEDMTLPMQMTDKWTILMLIIFVVQVVMRILTKNKKDEEDNNKNAYA